MRNAPALRLRGRNTRTRVYKIGRWQRDPLADVAAADRSSAAVDKALAESVRAARHAGHSWPQVAVALGLSPALTSWPQIADQLAARRQQLLSRTID